MIRVLIVDDHPLIMSGLIAELTKAGDIEIAGEATNGNEALEKVRRLKPDLVLLDIALPGKSGLEVLKDLHSEMADVKVLMLSAFPEKQYALRCLKSGAQGYLTKDMASTELLTAIRNVMKGRKFITASLADLLASEVGLKRTGLPHEILSDREFEVLCLLGEGNTISEIASRLRVSVSSVSTYRHRIQSKMHIDTTARLIRYVLDNNLAILKK